MRKGGTVARIDLNKAVIYAGPLSGTIWLASGSSRTLDKRDVSNEAKAAVIDHLLHGMPEGGKGMKQVFGVNGKYYEIQVKVLGEKPPLEED